ncbi:MAG: hypothetical protein AB7K09_05740 [Planctomycetota bacterium]
MFVLADNASSISSAITMALVCGLIAWLANAARKPALRDGDDYVLRYPLGYRVLAWILLIVPCLGAVLLAIFLEPGQPGEEWAPWIMLVVVLVLMSPLVLETRAAAPRVNRNGLLHVGAWTRSRFIAWDDMRSIRFGPVMQWTVFTGRDGSRIRVSMYLTGMSTLALYALHYVAPDVLADDRTEEYLENLAAHADDDTADEVIGNKHDYADD